MCCAEAHDAGTVDAFYGVKKPEAFAITGLERFGQTCMASTGKPHCDPPPI